MVIQTDIADSSLNSSHYNLKVQNNGPGIAETRYMVVPMRPAGTDKWSLAALAQLVTREAMIGVAMVPAPA